MIKTVMILLSLGLCDVQDTSVSSDIPKIWSNDSGVTMMVPKPIRVPSKVRQEVTVKGVPVPSCLSRTFQIADAISAAEQTRRPPTS